MAFLSDLLVLLLLIMYWMFMEITYETITTYSKKGIHLRDILFFIIHFFLFYRFFFTITSRDFRFYDLLLLGIGNWIEYKAKSYRILIPYLNQGIKLIKKVWVELWGSRLFRDGLKKLKIIKKGRGKK